MRIYKLFGSMPVAAITNSIATLDIVEDGKLVAFLLGMNVFGANLDDDFARMEIAFGSSNQFAINDTRQVIAEINYTQNFLTTGGGGGMSNVSMSGLNINVVAGERIHMHSTTDAGVSGNGIAFMYIEDGSGGTTRARRSR